MGKHERREALLEELKAQGLSPTGRTPTPPPLPQPIPVYQAPIPAVAYPAPPPLPEKYRSTTASVMVTGDAAVAEVAYQVPVDPAAVRQYEQEQGQTWNYVPPPQPKIFTGSGASKRERGDDHDPVTGEILAAARAFDELSARLFREARRRVRTQDAEKYQRSKRRTKEEWEQIQRTARMAHSLGLTPEQVESVGGLPDASGEFTGTYDNGSSIDATAIVKQSLKDVAAGLQSVIDVLK